MSKPYQRASKLVSMILLGLLLPALVFTSINAGISGDEYLHLEQAAKVLNYYKTGGQNSSALNTPVTNLKFYGQSFDNFTLLLSELFNIEDIFTFRHIMNAAAGWLTLLFAMLLTVEVAGWPTALVVVLLLSSTPAFTGHSLNNLKDIPFAMGYIASLFFMIKWIPKRQHPPFKLWIGLTLSLAMLFSIRPGGLLAFAYLWGFTLLTLLIEHRHHRISLNLTSTLRELIIISVTAWLLGCLFWPYALDNPVWHPIQSLLVMSDYPVTIRQLFDGNLQWSDLLPWYYLPKIMILTLPVAILPGLLLFVTTLPFRRPKPAIALNQATLVISTATFFPLIWIMITDANVYGSWRHILFILPPLIILSALGLKRAFNLLNKKIKRPQVLYSLGLLTLLFLLWHPLKFTIRNSPFQYLYFNQFAGGLQKSFGNYEADYYFHTIKPAAEWLDAFLEKSAKTDVVLASNFETSWFFRKKNTVKQHHYTNYYNKENLDWDYGIFAAAYLSPATIKNKLWPPKGTIHTINIDEVPVCAVVKRPTKATFLAIEALKSDRIELADSLLDVSLATDNENVNTWLQAGKVSLKKGDTDQALKRLSRALYLLPKYEPALLYTAITHTLNDHWDRGLSQLDDLIITNPKFLPAYLEKANIYLHKKNTERARQVLQKCLAIKPGYLPAVEKLDSIDYL